MYNKNLPGRWGLTDEFHIELELFLNFASIKYDFMDGNKLICQCKKCSNGKFLDIDKVREHLCRFEFIPNYYNWACPCEPFIHDEEYWKSNQFSVREECSYYNQLNSY